MRMKDPEFKWGSLSGQWRCVWQVKDVWRMRLCPRLGELHFASLHRHISAFIAGTFAFVIYSIHIHGLPYTTVKTLQDGRGTA
jgi:hypothetical protein